VWVLTPSGQNCTVVDEQAVVRFVRLQQKARRSGKQANHVKVLDQKLRADPQIAVDVAEVVAQAAREPAWQEQLMHALLNLPPSAFERLCQRLLRESGFTQVRVTGRSGDGGIDGVGLVQLGGLLSFPVLFQCKRYRGSVGAGAIRDFRGAMTGRADRGMEKAGPTAGPQIDQPAYDFSDYTTEELEQLERIDAAVEARRRLQ
jgi:restriction system protein